MNAKQRLKSFPDGLTKSLRERPEILVPMQAKSSPPKTREPSFPVRVGVGMLRDRLVSPTLANCSVV
jgi:hypothetical protein